MSRVVEDWAMKHIFQMSDVGQVLVGDRNT